MMVPREAMASNGHRLYLIKGAPSGQERVACLLIPGAAWIVDVLGDFVAVIDPLADDIAFLPAMLGFSDSY